MKSRSLNSYNNFNNINYKMPNYTLTYFDLRARAEPARLILAQVSLTKTQAQKPQRCVPCHFSLKWSRESPRILETLDGRIYALLNKNDRICVLNLHIFTICGQKKTSASRIYAENAYTNLRKTDAPAHMRRNFCSLWQ